MIGVRTGSGSGDVPRRLCGNGRRCRVPAKWFWTGCRSVSGTGSLWCCGRLRRKAVVRPASGFLSALIAGTSGGLAIFPGRAFRSSSSCMCAASFATTTNAVNAFTLSASQKRLHVTPGAPPAWFGILDAELGNTCVGEPLPRQMSG